MITQGLIIYIPYRNMAGVDKLQLNRTQTSTVHTFETAYWFCIHHLMHINVYSYSIIPVFESAA